MQEAYGGLGALGGWGEIRDPFAYNTELVEALYKFAIRKGVRPDNPNWFQIALRLAAAEHMPKKKGAPVKPRRGSLFMQLLGMVDHNDQAAAEHIAYIDEFNENARRTGAPELSDREFCGQLVAKAGHVEGSILFESNRFQWQKRLSAARKSLGKQKRIPKKSAD